MIFKYGSCISILKEIMNSCFKFFISENELLFKVVVLACSSRRYFIAIDKNQIKDGKYMLFTKQIDIHTTTIKEETPLFLHTKR